ncbi:MAG: hypothetical protein AAGH65_06450 [Pseudomonadota bacterium]
MPTSRPARHLLHMLLITLALLPETLLANLFAGNSVDEDELYRINPSTAQGVVVANYMDTFDLNSLAADPVRRVLYGMETDDNTLFTINSISGEITPIGTHVYDSRREGLAFDANRNQLYMSGNMNEGELLRVDPATGQISAIGSFGTDSGVMWGLAYDPASDTIYGTDLEGGESFFYRINPETGTAALVSVIGSTNEPRRLDGLTFDPASNTLYAVDAANDQLYIVDTTTGDLTTVGAPGLDDGYKALAFLDTTPARIPVNHPVALLMLCMLLGLLAYRRL